jgi:hypothetical protein
MESERHFALARPASAIAATSRFSRRLKTGDDLFAGVIVLVVRSDYFTAFHNDKVLGRKGMLMMIDSQQKGQKGQKGRPCQDCASIRREQASVGQQWQMRLAGLHDQAGRSFQNEHRAMALYIDRCLARLAQHDSKVQMSMQQMEAGVVVHDQDIRNHGVPFFGAANWKTGQSG